MHVAESPDSTATPLHVRADHLLIQDYLDADGHTAEQIPTRRDAIIIDGWPYVRDHDAPLDLLWARGN